MRTYSPELLTLLDEGRIRLAGMIRFDLGEGSYGFIRRSAPYVYGGVTYQPQPEGLLSVSDLPASTGTAAAGFTVTVSESPDDGLTPDVLAQIEDYDYRDRPVTIYDLFLHPDTGAVVGAPQAMVRGYINAIRHAEDPAQGYLMVIECETRALDYSRKNGRIRSNDDQKRRAPSETADLFYEHAGTAGRIKVNWGKT